MKLFFLFGFVFFYFSPLAQTLVAYYPFNGNADDASGSGNHATAFNGASLTTDRFGNAASAYSFDGIDDFMEASANILPMGNRTVSVWFSADPGSIASRPGLLGYGGNGGCGSSYLMAINNTPAAVGSYQIQSHCNNNQLLYSYPSVPENSWYNWTVTISGTTSKMYINGLLVATGTYSDPTQVAGAKLSIGAVVSITGSANYTDGNVSRFKGKIDDIKIYNDALSDVQVASEYYEGNRRPGSGKGLSFDGADDYMTFKTTGFTGIQSYTIECWLKPNAVNSAGHVWESNAGSAPSLENNGNANGSLNFYVGNSNQINTGPLTIGKWYHIACVYNNPGFQQELFVNGVRVGSNIVSVSDALGPDFGFMVRAFFTGPSRFYNGELDEVRIWNLALNETNIRSRMCRKIFPNDPLYANLVAYYRFDLENGSMVNNLKGNNDASLFNGPLWVKSGAALGDAAANDYSATPSATLSHPQGESLQATITSGAPSGIHIYRVDEAPDHINGGPGIGDNNRYFGVFVTDGISPQYTVTYNYAGNPFVNAGNENNLLLYKRANNAAPAWTDAGASLNTGAKTLTATGQSTEYILGLSVGTLPVRLVQFTALKKKNTVQLDWATSNELNNAGFEVQRSSEGKNYAAIGWVPVAATGFTKYRFDDQHPGKAANYYRLKQIDADGKFSYSSIRKVDFSSALDFTMHPNPVANALLFEFTDAKEKQIEVWDMMGRRVWVNENISTLSFMIPVQSFHKGIYVVKVKTAGGETRTEKFIKE